MGNPKTEADRLFEAYLDSHEYEYEYEPNLRTRLALTFDPPRLFDYLIERESLRAVCEVRGFESRRITDRLMKSGGYGTLPEKEVFGTQRAGLVEKATELACLGDEGVPIVIVLHQGGSDAQLDYLHVSVALFGNDHFVVPIHTQGGGPAGPGRFVLEGYGAFRQNVDGEVINPHPHVSAVVTLHERTHEQDWLEAEAQRHKLEGDGLAGMADYLKQYLTAVSEARQRGDVPDGSYQWVEVYELDGDLAVPAPRDAFNGPRDKRYGFLAPDRYGEVA